MHQVFLVSQGREDENAVSKWFKTAGYFSVIKLARDVRRQREGGKSTESCFNPLFILIGSFEPFSSAKLARDE